MLYWAPAISWDTTVRAILVEAIPVMLLVPSQGDSEGRTKPHQTPLARPVLWLRVLSPWRKHLLPHTDAVQRTSHAPAWNGCLLKINQGEVTEASQIHEVLALANALSSLAYILLSPNTIKEIHKHIILKNQIIRGSAKKLKGIQKTTLGWIV